MRTGHRSLAAALAVVLASCATATAPGSSVDPASPVSPAPTPAPPDTVVARQDDAVIRVDVASGEVTDRITVDDGAGVDDLELAASRGVAVLTRPRSDGPDELVEVTLATGSSRVLGHGDLPAVSDDGSHLAFVRTRPDGDHRELVATTYEGSEEGVWPIEDASREDVEVVGLTWSATGEELAITLRSSAGLEVRLLPIDHTGTLRGASEVVAGLGGPVTHLDWDPALTHLLITLEGSPALQRWGADGLQDVGVEATSAEW